MTLEEQLLEIKIQKERVLAEIAHRDGLCETAALHYKLMGGLIGQRSSSRVKEMEKEKGLA